MSYITTAEEYSKNATMVMPGNKKHKKKTEVESINMDNDSAIDNFNVLRLELVNTRKAKHLTQKQVSMMCGLSESCISNLENTDSKSSPTIRSLIRYAKALGMNLYLRFEDE